jgi:hypothetical protein
MARPWSLYGLFMSFINKGGHGQRRDRAGLIPISAN